MPTTIFLSWQSDRPNRVGRSLIEGALEAAVKQAAAAAAIEPAERPEVLSGTKGEVGIVPLADTILKRIDAAGVVVADLTYVSKRPKGQCSPNPNVLLEFGYALNARGGGRMIAVMNTAFGHPGTEPLPFDLAHLTWPVLFDCPAEASEDQRRKARDTLTNALVVILKKMLADPLPSPSLLAPHPHDVLLLEIVYATFPLAFREFLARHDFGVQFPTAMLNPLHEAAEWTGATFTFHDPAIDEKFVGVRQLANTLTDCTNDYIYTSGEPLVATVKTEIDRAWGLQPATRQAIRTLNRIASELAEALNALELVGRARLPVSSLQVAPSDWPSTNRPQK
jgi:hypothetical protein